MSNLFVSCLVLNPDKEYRAGTYPSAYKTRCVGETTKACALGHTVVSAGRSAFGPGALCYGDVHLQQPDSFLFRTIWRD